MSRQETTAQDDAGEVEDVAGATVEVVPDTPVNIESEPEVTPAVEQVVPPVLDPAHYFGR